MSSHDTASLSLVAYNQTISRTEVGLGSAVSVLLFLCDYEIGRASCRERV